MQSYLRLTDGEWAAIRRILPPQSRLRRKNDREAVTALLFCEAACCSMDSLPVGLLNPLSLRTTIARWRACGALDAAMRVGEPAVQRMRRQYQQHIADLSMRRMPSKAQPEHR